METGTSIFISEKRWKINKKYASQYLKFPVFESRRIYAHSDNNFMLYLLL